MAGIGIALPGFLDTSRRILASPNLPGLRGADLGTPLRARLDLPVSLENDALCAAWGEFLLHPEPPLHLVYVGLGTGVGGGLVLDARPFRGAGGVAMEVGHVIVEPGGRRCGCGNRGCLECYASATGVCASWNEATGEEGEAHEVAARARTGEAAARAAFEKAGTTLAVAIAHVMKILDVPDVVIGGGMSAAWDLIEPSFTRRLEADLIPTLRGRVRVRVSASRDQAGMIGAAWLSMREDDRGEGTGDVADGRATVGGNPRSGREAR